MKKTQIVVVGGGAGGLELVRKLGAYFGRDRYDVILIDKNRTHIWKPLLHEVAAGSLDANLDEVGFGGHGARWGYRFFYGAFEGIDRERRVVRTSPLLDENGDEIIGAHEIRYDYLVLAVGGTSNDFGIPGVSENAMFLENRLQADQFRSKLLNACFRVSHAVATGNEDASVNLVIVGGGAYVAMFAMLATSNDAAIRKMGSRNWRRLHKFGAHYLAFVFVFTYTSSLVEPWSKPILLIALAWAAILLRIFIMMSSRKRSAT